MLIHEQGPVGLLFIPAWLDQALVDNNKPMSALLSYAHSSLWMI